MEKSCIYRLYESMNIAEFEQVYSEVKMRIAKGDDKIGDLKCSGFMAECDKVYAKETSEYRKKMCVYLSIVQLVFTRLTKDSELAHELNNFFDYISEYMIVKAFEMSEADVNNSGVNSQGEFDYFQITEDIMMIPFVNYGYKYKEAGPFLHPDVVNNPDALLGNVAELLYVIEYISKKEYGNTTVETISVRDTQMIGKFFPRKYQVEQNNTSSYGQNIPAMPMDLHAALSNLEESTRQQLQATMQNYASRDMSIEDMLATSQAQNNNANNYSRSKSFFGGINRLIEKFFGKKTIAFAWIAMILALFGNFVAGVGVIVIVYVLSRIIK